jgi:hypothetical protein
MYNILYSHRIPVEFPRLIVICMRSGRRVSGARVRGTTNTFSLVLYFINIINTTLALKLSAEFEKYKDVFNIKQADILAEYN